MEESQMKIGIGSDHGGYLVKEQLKTYLQENYEIIDFGTDSVESTDYPTYAFLVGNAVADKKIEKGILVCTTGIGMSIACNKVHGVRCAKVDSNEEAVLTRQHNNSNVIALSAKKSIEEIKQIIATFLTTEFSNEERHMRRNQMIDHYGE